MNAAVLATTGGATSRSPWRQPVDFCLRMQKALPSGIWDLSPAATDICCQSALASARDKFDPLYYWVSVSGISLYDFCLEVGDLFFCISDWVNGFLQGTGGSACGTFGTERCSPVSGKSRDLVVFCKYIVWNRESCGRKEAFWLHHRGKAGYPGWLFL